jgi:hypothetical protein
VLRKARRGLSKKLIDILISSSLIASIVVYTKINQLNTPVGNCVSQCSI